jgi:hypothetical protein
VTFNGPAALTLNDSGTVATGGFGATKYVMPNMRVFSVPALATTTTFTPTVTTTTGTEGAAFANSLNGNGLTATTADQIGERLTPATNGLAAYAGILWTPTHAGTYSFLFWDDVNIDGALGGATEKYIIATFVVGNEIASLTASTVINNGTTVRTTYSSVVKVVAKDAAGNATVPSELTA